MTDDVEVTDDLKKFQKRHAEQEDFMPLHCQQLDTLDIHIAIEFKPILEIAGLPGQEALSKTYNKGWSKTYAIAIYCIKI